MSKESKSTNDLLYGLLAVKLNVVDRSALLSVLKEWLKDGEPSIPERLSQRSSISPTDEKRIRFELKEQFPPNDETHVSIANSISHFESMMQTLLVEDKDDDSNLDETLQGVFEQLWAGPGDVGNLSSAGRFRSIRFHARGGLGEVHVAEDCEMHRQVALKQIRPAFADQPASRARFITEAEITGRLEHPSIVPIYGMGEGKDGRPFYAMKFIHGESLKEKLNAIFKRDVEKDRKAKSLSQNLQKDQAGDRSTHLKTLDKTESFQNSDNESSAMQDSNRDQQHDESKHIDSASNAREKGIPAGRKAYADWFEALPALLNDFVTICQAIEYAHQRGVVHRDIKPANVMLGPYGETLVVDWGLAKVLSEEKRPSQSQDAPELSVIDPKTGNEAFETIHGRAVGTLPYASPEQVAGLNDQVGPASDIYSLGATLYEILTGVAPFKGEFNQLVADKKKGKFAPPRQVNRHVPVQLEAICLHAMKTDPEQRYQSAQALAEDINRYLADRPVSVHKDSIAVRARRVMKRHRTIVSGAIAATVVGSIAALLIASLTMIANAELAESNRQKQLNAEKVMLNDINLATRRGEWEKAYDLIEAALKEDFPTVTETELRIMLVKTSYGRFSGKDFSKLAIDLYESPHDPRYDAEIGILYADAVMLRNSGERPLEILQEAIKAPESDLPESERNYAKMLLCENTVEAIDLLEEIVNYDPFHLRAQHMLVSNLILLGRYQDVEQRIATARSVFPNDLNFDLLSAWRHANLGEREKLREDLQRLKGKISDNEYEMIDRILGNLEKLSGDIMDNYDTPTQTRAMAEFVAIMQGLIALGVSPYDTGEDSNNVHVRFSPGLSAIKSYGELKEFMAASLFNQGIVDPAIADRIGRLTERHPDGLLFMIQGLIYFTNEGQTEKAIRAFDKASRHTSILPNVQREACFSAAMARAKYYYVEGHQTEEVISEAIVKVDQRLSFGPIKELHSDYLAKLCLVAEEYALVDEIVDPQLSRRPNDTTFLRYKIKSLLLREMPFEALFLLEKVKKMRGSLDEEFGDFQQQALDLASPRVKGWGLGAEGGE